MSEQDAVAYANEWAAKSMGDRSKGATPTIFERKSPVLKAFTMFQLEVNNQFRFLFKDLPRAAKKRGKAWLAFTFGKELFAALLINLLFEKLTGRKPAFSPVDMGYDVYKIWSKKEVATSEKVKQTAEEMLQELPFIGSLFGGSRIFALSGLPDVATLVESGGDIIDASRSERNAETQEDKDAAKLAKQQAWGSFGTEAARWASYLPVNVNAFGGQVSKSIKGAKSVGQGAEYMSTAKGDRLKYTVDQDATNWIKALLFGKYAVKESTQYYDSGSFAGDLLNYISGNGFSTSQKGEGKSFAEPNKPLSVADTRRYKEVTESKLMTGTEFIGVVTQINKQESDKDKNGETIEGSKAANIANVIDMSGLDDKQAEYLYQNYVLTNDDREKLVGTNISAQDYYVLKSIKPDYENGKAVENSQKEKIIDAIDILGLKGKDERDVYKIFLVDEDGQKKASKAGVSVVQYYEITHIEGDKNYDGTSVSGSKSRKVAEYIDAMPSGNKSNLYLEFVLSDTQVKKYEELDGILTPQDVYNIMSITATPGLKNSGANKKREYIYGLGLDDDDEALVFEAFDVSPKMKRETKTDIRPKKADYETYWEKAKDIGVSKETFTKVFEEALDMTDKEYDKNYWKIIDEQRMSISMKKALRGIFD
jgi:hypothetical protein